MIINAIILKFCYCLAKRWHLFFLELNLDLIICLLHLHFSLSPIDI